MQISLYLLSLSALLLCVLVPQACAEEQPVSPIEVKGLVVSSRDGLTINDGTKDYILLGVDNIGIEGRVCTVFGDLSRVDGELAIDVFEIRLVPEGDPDADSIGFHKDWHTLKRTVQSDVGQVRQASPYDLAYRICASLASELGRNDVTVRLGCYSKWPHIVPATHNNKKAA